MKVIKEAAEPPLSGGKATGGLQWAADLGRIVTRDLGYGEKEMGTRK